MAARKRKKVDKESIRQKLKLKGFETKLEFQKKYPKAYKYLKEKGLEIDKAREHSAKIIGAGALTGSLLLAPPNSLKPLPDPHKVLVETKDDGKIKEVIGKQKVLVENLEAVLPDKVRPLVRNEEKYLELLISGLTGIDVRATLESEHLNTTYGLIGAEQHLRRYPGDSISNHDEKTQVSGMAPGLGAWGYFAASGQQLTHELAETEKWYAVVQTLYLPDWNTRQPHLKNWYKYRKVMIVNTLNGNAVVAAIADSGPAAWTGKHFGGSPEVMDYLGGSRYKKGPVLILFVDDPENKIPLGPVDYNKLELETNLVSKI